MAVTWQLSSMVAKMDWSWIRDVMYIVISIVKKKTYIKNIPLRARDMPVSSPRLSSAAQVLVLAMLALVGRLGRRRGGHGAGVFVGLGSSSLYTCKKC
jgi:hypothetical protein